MRWVTFDCFGTLVDWRSGFAAILTPVFGDKTPDAMRVYDRFERILEAETPHRQYRDVLTAGLLHAAEDIGVPLSESQARRLPEQWGTMPVFADVEPMLAGLRAEGCRLAMLTNCDEDLFAETQRAFRAPFDLVDDGLPASRFILEEAETVAAKLGVQLVVVKAPPGHYDRAFVGTGGSASRRIVRGRQRHSQSGSETSDRAHRSAPTSGDLGMALHRGGRWPHVVRGQRSGAVPARGGLRRQTSQRGKASRVAG